MMRYFNKLYLFSYVLIALTILITILSCLYQPLIGDDYAHKFSLSLVNGNFLKYFNFVYTEQTGRIIVITLDYFIYKYENILYFFKFIIVPFFFFSTWLAWYLGTNQFITVKSSNFWKYICFSILIWLAIPAIDETIIFSAGSNNYFWPMFIVLLFLGLLKYFLSIINELTIFKKILLFATTIILGFLSGCGQEQLSFSVLVILLFWIIKNILSKQKQKNSLIYFAIMATLIGFILMVSAPGNFNRFEQIEVRSFFSHLITFFLYLFSAFFKLADEDKGVIFWLSLFILIYLFNPKFNIEISKLKNSAVWIIASLSCLFVMLPLSSSISLRTTFFSFFFAYIFILKLNFTTSNNEFNPFFKNSLLIILSCSFFFDSFSGLLANRSLSSESNHRMTLIDNAILNDKQYVEVPYFTTIPSRLTFIQSPEHDEKYLKFHIRNNLLKISIDKSEFSPAPFTNNTLKNFKFKY